jgi:hypothetical protein
MGLGSDNKQLGGFFARFNRSFEPLKNRRAGQIGLFSGVARDWNAPMRSAGKKGGAFMKAEPKFAAASLDALQFDGVGVA